MNAKNEKMELAKMIPNTKGENWWDELPVNVMIGLTESLDQANQGKFISYGEVKKQVSVLFEKETRDD